MELRLFNKAKGEVSYDNQRNQSFYDYCFIKARAKDLGIKLIRIAVCLRLVIELSELFVCNLLPLAYYFWDIDSMT
jgi:hypothetical protein